MRPTRISAGLVKAISFFLALALGLGVAVGPASAQGRSDSAPGQNKDSAPGQNKEKDKPSSTSSSSNKSSNSGSGSSGNPTRSSESGIASPVTSTTATSAPVTSANAVIYYGSWLDDASVVAPGDLWVSMSTGYWKADANRQIDAPVISAAVGINSRMQAGGSASFYHFRDAEGVSESGVGSMSMYGKFLVIDAASNLNGFGLAVTPLVEISPGSQDEIGWALPVNVEKRRGNLRIYGSTGYFSRGSIFATVGADMPLGSRISISGNFGQSYARVGTHQSSFGVGAFMTLTSTSGAFVGIGQTMMPTQFGPGGVSLAGGFSFLLPQPTHP
jgi:hypothetical protein